MTEYVSRPSLSTWGIEEVEANVCEDTFENRQKLTAVKLPFKVLEAGLIEVQFEDYGELNKHHASQFEQKKIILKDIRNPWSDYLPFDELPLDYMEVAPAWIKRHLNKYEDAVAEGVAPHKLPILPNRCLRVRADGSRCWQWGWPNVGSKGFCRQHGDRFAFDAMGQMNKLNDAAKMRLSQLTEPSLAALEDLVLNSTVPAVRLKAATEVLDRVGIRGGTELTVSGSVEHEIIDARQVISEKLDLLRERHTKAIEAAAEAEKAEIIVEGEVVEEVQSDE